MNKNIKVLVLILLFIITCISGNTKSSTTDEYPTSSYPTAVAWRLNSPILAIGYENGSLVLINTTDNQQNVVKCNSSIFTLEWDKTGSLLAIGTENGIDIWNFTEGEFTIKNVELYNYQKIFALGWSNDSSTVYAGSASGINTSLFAWNLNTQEITKYIDNRDYIFDLSVKQDQSAIAVASNTSIFIFNITNAPVHPLTTSIYDTPANINDYIGNSVYWTKDNKTLVTVLNGGNISLWDTTNLSLLRSYSTNETIFGTNYDFVTNVLVVTHAKEALVYNLSNTSNFIEIGKDYHLEDIHCLSLSRSTNLLALGSFDHSVSIWNINSGELISTLGQKIKIIVIKDNDGSSNSITTSRTVPINLSFSIIALIIVLIFSKKRKEL